jgi:hypothetical protein
MSIDYDGINKNAEKRRTRLRDLDEILSEQPIMLAKLKEVYEWATAVHRAHAFVDAEGKTLLPHTLRCALVNSNVTVERLASAMDSNGAGIAKWAS